MDRDVFICHASEDKQDIVIPLATALRSAGVTCWVDEGEIKWGDSITQTVNEGLKNSQFFIVVLSQSLLGKNWPERELFSTLNTEASSGEVKVLPLLIGNKLARQKILQEYPLLNDKRYEIWDGDPSSVVEATLKRLARPPKAVTGLEHLTGNIISDDEIPLPKVRKGFSQRDKDLFIKESFEVIKDYFQRALTKLESTYPNLETDFTEIHTQKFIIKIYLSGDVKCRCKIWVGGPLASNGIAYSNGWVSADQDNSYNEIIIVEDDGFELYLGFLMGILHQQPTDKQYNSQDAAKALWSMFTAPLERI